MIQNEEHPQSKRTICNIIASLIVATVLAILFRSFLFGMIVLLVWQIIALIPLLTKQYTIRGNYKPINSFTTSTPYDQVWNNIIDLFAEYNIPIGILSKDSGLITALNIALDERVVSYENKDGIVTDDNAWFVVPYAPYVVGARATCSFNVRVRQLEGDIVRIQININDMIGYYDCEFFNPLLLKKDLTKNTYPQECRSTGKFETTLLTLFNN